MDANNPTIDDFEPEIREMAATSTQQQLLQWLQQRGVVVSLRTLNRHLVQWEISRQTRVFATDETASELLAQAVDFLFHHQPTYSDTEIAIRIREDHNLYTTARNIQQIRLQNGWLRRQNDPDERAIEQLQLTAFIEELLLQGHIRPYGRRHMAGANSLPILLASMAIAHVADRSAQPSLPSIPTVPPPEDLVQKEKGERIMRSRGLIGCGV
jgi:hypothetical protein